MITAETKYLGKLRCSSVHLKSGAELITDAPIDNKGMGSSYSPTDLCALSLTTCIITTIAIYAEFKKIKVISIEGATTKIMANTPPRRIDSIDVTIHVKLPITSEDRVKTGIERAAHACPVSKSLHPEINQNVVVNFIQ
jgi:uncharacterized OsmC-like protein